MGTEAQQALQRRRPAIARSGDPRNAQGTRRAQQQALQRTGTKARTRRARGPSKGAIRDANWDQAADQQRAEFKQEGYGGMGYGPTAANQGGLSADPAMKKVNARANPRQMVREALGKIAEPTVVRSEGSIWDDPKYSGLANEHGADYAMKARNLDRQLNMARQTAQIRGEAQANQLAMDRGKLMDQQIQHAAEPYAPNAQGTGVDPNTGLATSGSVDTAHGSQPVFTGDIKHAQATGPGPASEAEVKQQEAGMTQQHEIRQKGIDAISDRLSAEYDKPELDRNPQKIRALEARLDKLLGLDGGQDTGGGKQTVKHNGQTFSVGDTLPNGRKLTKIYDDGTVEVE